MSCFKYILNHWRRFFTLIVLAIISVFFLKKFSNVYYKDGNQIIEIFNITLQNWGTLLAILGTSFTLFWAMFQYDKQLARSQQEKAYSVAELFANELIERMTIVGEILKNYEPLKEIYSKIDFDRLHRFDIYEIEYISKDKKIFEKFSDIFDSDEINEYYHEFMEENFPERKIYNKKRFSTFVTETNNKLEAVCINISSNAAGESYLYPSLHQVLIPFIQQISLNISILNGNYTYKYFINTIEVYNNWISIRDKEQARETKEQNKLDKNIKKYSRKIDAIQNKALEKKPRKL